MWIIDKIDDAINHIRIMNEKDHYYSVFRDVDPISSEDIHGITIVDGFYVVFFNSQDYMLEMNIVAERRSGWGRVDETEYFTNWLKENLRGFYTEWGWGNGRYNNSYQHQDGIWHYQIWCAREEDAMAIKLAWF